MGIEVHGLRLLEHAFRTDGPMGSTLTIGRQCLSVKRRELRKYLEIPAGAACLASPFIDDLLTEHFGATTIASVDVSDYEGCTYVRDLNLPLEPGFPQFDLILDGGCLEHIMDALAAFRNIARCCKVGGRILHITAANNCVGHGFYQFSPDFFFALYGEDQGFTDTEVFLADRATPDIWWKVDPPAGLARSTTLSSNETLALVRTKKTAEVAEGSVAQQQHFVSLWQSDGDEGPVTPARGRLKVLSDSLPTNARARLVQMRTRVQSGMHPWNPALTRVRPPARRSGSPARPAAPAVSSPAQTG